MRREDMADLTAFVVVAEEQSFTHAAAKLGISQSALSQIVRRLETRIGLRLLSRTTRSVAPTDAGQRLLQTLQPALEDLDASIAALSEFREKPAGTIRINSVEHATEAYLWPALKKLLPDYPDLNVEIVNDYGLTDIVSERYDAGVRLGGQVAKDMIAVRIAPDMPMALVGSPAYFDKHPPLNEPQDLVRHRCINLRVPTSGGLYVWPFKKKGHELNVRTEGQLVFNAIDIIVEGAVAGLGLSYQPQMIVQAYIDAGRLTKVLPEWSQTLPGYHLYYPSRRQPTPAFALLVNALRYRGLPRVLGPVQ